MNDQYLLVMYRCHIAMQNIELLWSTATFHNYPLSALKQERNIYRSLLTLDIHQHVVTCLFTSNL